GIEARQWNTIAREGVALPDAVHKPRCRRIEDRIRASPVEIALLHLGTWGGCVHLRHLLLMQALIAEEEERLVAAVIHLRDVNRAAYVGVGHHEEDRKAVRTTQRGLGSPQLVEEQPVLHAASAPVPRSHAVQFVGSAFLYDTDHAAG